MKFGLSFLPDARPQDKSAADYFRDITALCNIADANGIHYVKMTEHYLHPYGGYCPNPLIFLAHIANSTRQIRLMTGCILPVFHHPLQIASQTAMLDALSGGRLDVGFARAYLPYEFDAFNINMDESRARFTQTIATVIRLWTEQNVSVDCPFYQFNAANNYPAVVQKPHPPVWIAAVNARQSFSWIGEQGYNLLISPPPTGLAGLADKIEVYHESFFANQRQHGNSKPLIALSLPLLIAKNNEQATLAGDKYLRHYLDIWSDAANAWNTHSSSNYPGYTGLGEILRANYPLKMRQERQAIIGTPNKVLEDLAWIQQQIPIDTFLLQIDFGAQPAAIMQDTLHLFIDEVLPYLNTQ